MNEREAHRILHPDTSRDTLWAYEYYGGFNGREAWRKAVEDARLVACEALEKQIPKKPTVKHLGDDLEVQCPACKDYHMFIDAREGNDFCSTCGQKLDWSEEDEG